MKIGLVCPYSIVKGGGVLEIVRAQQAELIRRGHAAYIITPRPQGHISKPDDHTIFVGTSTDLRTISHTTIQVSAATTEEVEDMLEREKFDVLHFHEPWIPMLSPQILSRSKAANVATFHAALPEAMMIRTLAKVAIPYSKSILKYIDAFTAVSDPASEYICSITTEPVSIIPNAIADRFIRPTKLHDNRKQKTILYVGRLEGRKGVKYLLHAFAELQQSHPELKLLIGGAGPDRDKLEILADDLDLRNIKFLGYLKDKEKIKLLQTSDLFCVPSLFGESFGLVLLEAMGSGLVTVAGDNAGYRTVMTGVGAISLINPKHTQEFARRLELLLYEHDIRKLWRSWAEGEMPKYTYKSIVDQYLEVYDIAIKKRKAREQA